MKKLFISFSVILLFNMGIHSQNVKKYAFGTSIASILQNFVGVIPDTPTVSVVDTCGGTSILRASNFTGTLLWSTGETTPSIIVKVGGKYTVTQTVDVQTSAEGSAFATPVPTITGPFVLGLPATLDGGLTENQGYKTESGKDGGYVWSVSSAGEITAGQGTDSILVRWKNPTGNQSVSVSYKSAHVCSAETPTVLIINYFPFPLAINPAIIPQFVDPLPHFAAGLRVDAKAGGDLVIAAKMVQQVALSTGTPTSTGVIGDPKTPNAGKGNYAAYAISLNGGDAVPAMWPAFTIEARQGKQLKVKYENHLVGVKYSDFNILADQTLMMNGYPKTDNPLTDPYTGDIPMVVHLHGGEMPSNSDGGPTAWFMPTGNLITGPGYDKNASGISTYPNKQEATTLWYHPHDQGLTRLNVYTGLAGYYFIRGDAEETAKLPGWTGDDKVVEVQPVGKSPTFNGANAYLPEIEIAIQDRMFNVKGELFWPIAPPNPDVHPFWAPEFFGDVMTVNGKSWPYLSVAPRKYRFRMLGGCNARFVNVWLAKDPENPNTNFGPIITVIGTDGGLLDTPATLNPGKAKTLTIGPGERYDVVIDFTDYPDGTVFTLMNDAPTPYPNGDPVEEGTTDRIMQFVVNGKMVSPLTPTDYNSGKDMSSLNANLRTANPMVKLTDFKGNLTVGVTPIVKRQIILNEISGAGGPVQVLFNNSHFDGNTPIPGAPYEFGGPTEIPFEGSTEQFTIINTTEDAHPIHIHLAQWQLVKRQKFNVDDYMNKYSNAWAANPKNLPQWPAGQGYPGGSGSPYPYDSIINGFVGGNPDVTRFLTLLPRAPKPEEMGWKDDIVILPGEVNTYIVRFAPTDVPLDAPASKLLYPFDPSVGLGYVWHCHIVDHEDMDMMRPLLIKPSALRFPQITGQPQSAVACIGNTKVFTVIATNISDPTKAVDLIKYQWQTSIDAGATWTDLVDAALYSGVSSRSLTVNTATMIPSTKLYRVVLNNIDGKTTSDVISLKVEPAPPAFVVPTVRVTQPTCVLLRGMITVTAPRGVGMMYSIDGKNYQSSPIFWGLTSGNYAVMAKYAGGCISEAISVTINDYPLANKPGDFTASTGTVNQGQQNVTYTVPFVAGVTYKWSYSGLGATIVGASNSVLVSFSATATSGTLYVRASNSCGMSLPRSISILVNRRSRVEAEGSGLIEAPLATNGLNVYPNPFTDRLFIEFSNETDTHVRLEIFDLTGVKLETLFDDQIKGGEFYKSEYVPKMISTHMVIYRMTIGDKVLRGKAVYHAIK